MNDYVSLEMSNEEMFTLHSSLQSRAVLVEKLLKLKGLDPELRASYKDELDTIHKLIAKIMYLY